MLPAGVAVRFVASYESMDPNGVNRKRFDVNGQPVLVTSRRAGRDTVGTIVTPTQTVPYRWSSATGRVELGQPELE